MLITIIMHTTVYWCLFWFSNLSHDTAPGSKATCWNSSRGHSGAPLWITQQTHDNVDHRMLPDPESVYLNCPPTAALPSVVKMTRYELIYRK